MGGPQCQLPQVMAAGEVQVAQGVAGWQLEGQLRELAAVAGVQGAEDTLGERGV